MPKVMFRSHEVDKVAPALEEMLRAELGAPSPIPYEVEQGPPRDLGTFLGEVARAAIGGTSDAIRLFTIYFNIAHPRPAQLRVMVGKQGIASYAGSLLYSCTLNAQVAGEVAFTEGKPSTFTGDKEASARLNANPDLLKRLDKLLRKRLMLGGAVISTNPICRIAPSDTDALLIVNTLSRPTQMGFSATLDAKEFFDLAGIIEGLLR